MNKIHFNYNLKLQSPKDFKINEKNFNINEKESREN